LTIIIKTHSRSPHESNLLELLTDRHPGSGEQQKKVHSLESVELRLPLVWPLDLCFRSNLKPDPSRKL
jgi:hypothetical protein